MEVSFFKKNLGIKTFILISIVLLGVSIFNACSKDKEAELSVPTNLSAVQVGKEIIVTWDDVAGATSYHLAISSASYVGSHEVYSTRWSYTPVLIGVNSIKVRFKVASADGTRISDFSREISCDYSVDGNDDGNDDGNGDGDGDGSILSAPQGVWAKKHSSNNTWVSIGWNNVKGASTYSVYRSKDATGTYSLINSVSGLSAVDKSPLSGNNYYKIKASNGSITSNYSEYAYFNYVSGSDDDDEDSAPSAPTGVTCANECSAIYPCVVIRWSAVANATSYKVYRSSSANGYYSQIGSSTNGNSLVDENPKNGDNYYKVKAINSKGESAYSNYVLYNFIPNDVSPCPVTYGNCTVSGTTITMRWTVPNQTGCGVPTKAYLRVKNPSSTKYADVQTLSGTATSASFNYGMWVDSQGYVYVGIITENAKGTSGGVPKVYDTKNKKWIN